MRTRRELSALALVGALVLAGCADSDDALDDADPGLDATIDAPAENTATLEGDAAAEDDPSIEVLGDDPTAASTTEALVPDGVTPACFEAVAAAGDETAVEGFEDDASPLWPAFDACASIEEFALATDSVSGIMGDEDPGEYVRGLCEEISEVQSSVLCLEAQESDVVLDQEDTAAP